jgi:hypothetical protein
MISSQVSNAIRPEENVSRSAIRVSNAGGVWQRFKLTRTFLASVAVTNGTRNRNAQGFQFDAST